MALIGCEALRLPARLTRYATIVANEMQSCRPPPLNQPMFASSVQASWPIALADLVARWKTVISAPAIARPAMVAPKSSIATRKEMKVPKKPLASWMTLVWPRLGLPRRRDFLAASA